MKKRTSIFPAQLIQALASRNNWAKTPEIVLTIKRFQELVKNLEPDMDFDFGYNELLSYSKRFSSSEIIVIEEMEIHLHGKAIDQMLSHLKWYNSMYPACDIDKIYTTWEKLKK